MVRALTEQATSRYAVVDGLKIHYNEAGSGPVLICCEGQGPGTSAWVVYHRVFEALSQHFRCILVDQPGYGKSDAITVKGESRSTMYARYIRGLMNELGIDQATIVDMSFGAQTGQVLAVESPERIKNFKREIEKVLKQGFASIKSNQYAGLQAISYPIFDQHANAIAALTVPMLARIDDEAQMGIDAVREKLAEASLLISNRISLNL
jgi:hypothetical protein